MGIPERWQRGLKPDLKVVSLVSSLHDPAAQGQVRAIGVVTVDPLLNVEFSVAGDIDPVRKRVLAAGLIELSQKLLKSE